MTAPFKVLRGLEIDLPVLDEGAIAFTTDSHKFFVGSSTGNVEITNQVANMTDYLDKATFDADDDGVVDVAASVDWSGVQNVPTQVSNLTQDVIDDSHAHNNTTALDNVTQSVVDNSHAANVLGTKVLDETGLSDGDVIKYDLTLDKWVVASDNEGTGGGSGGVYGNFFPILNGLSTQRFILGNASNYSLAGASFGTDLITYVPFIPAKNVEITKLGGWPTTSRTGNYRVGIYSSQNGLPYQLLVQTGSITQVNTVFVEETVTTTELIAGNLYFAAVVGSALNYQKRFVRDNTRNNFGLDIAGGTELLYKFTESIAAGWSTMPATAGTVAAATGDLPCIFAQVQDVA